MLHDPDIADELVALASALRDRKLADTWLPAALAHAKETVTPGELPQYERILRAMAALAGGRYQDAYTLASAVPVRLKTSRAGLVAGLAALQLQQWDEARKAFEAVLALRTQSGLDAVMPLARVYLARAQAGAGDRAAARATYEAAFERLKNADADLPVLVEARTEYANTKDTKDTKDTKGTKNE